MKDNTAYLKRINEAYLAEDYDKYELLIEKCAKEFDVTPDLAEDWATEYRYVEIYGVG